jgi:hypothetical protein
VALAVRDPAGRVGLGLADLAVPHPVDPVVLAHIRDPVGRADLDLEDRVDLAVPVGLGLADRAGPVDQGMGRAGLVGLDLADLVGRVDLGMDRVDLAGRVAQAMNPVDPADRVDPADPADRAGREDPADLVDRASLAIRADRKRRTRPEVLSTGVGPRWADPGMCRTASAPPTTVHRLRPDNTDGAGMAGPRPERSRLGGTDHRPRVAGAVRHLPVVGTVHGMVRRVTGASRSAISGRSITTGTTRSRCSIRSLGDGASGSSDSGFRCTETT